MTTSFYITTPIYYVNDAPHLGHAYATIAADSLARFHRALGEDTYFLTGTDEHGQKIEEAAASKGKAPKALADEVVGRFQATWQTLGVANDDFLRTTEDRHKRFVAAMWQRMEAAGDIYLGSYEGWYCVGCEAFYPENQLLEGRRCPTHESATSWVSEPSYFFRMSKYAQPLLAHFQAHPDFVQPENYRNEIVSFLKSGLRDLSVSRTSFEWGIPVPGAANHVVYVWIDALSNYLSALGGVDSELYQRFWPASCHLIGKDILRFHAVYWPCMLMSVGLPLPRTIFTTGWWTVRGAKMSKSLPATRVDPNRLAADLGADALRYFLLREVPLGLDGDFSYEALITRYNADLANDLGNLLNRTLSMTGKFTAGKVPPASPAPSPTPGPTPSPTIDQAEPGASIYQVARDSMAEAARCFGAYAPSRALEAIWALVREGNRYVDACQPWKLAKDPARAAELAQVMRTALEVLCAAARMVAPVMPEKAGELLGQLGVSGEARAALLARWPDPARFGQELAAGSAVAQGQVLFPRIDKDREAELLARWLPAGVAPAASAPAAPADKPAKAKGAAPAGTSGDKPAAAQPPAAIGINDVAKVDLRVAQVLAAEAVAGTKKLLELTVDVGGGDVRQVVSGIADVYQPAALVGRKVILVANLAPATIRGVESRGMILAAGDGAVLGLATIDGDVPVGTKVR